MPDLPEAPDFLVDVIERQFGLAPYVTRAVWERAYAEGGMVVCYGSEVDTMQLCIDLWEEPAGEMAQWAYA